MGGLGGGLDVASKFGDDEHTVPFYNTAFVFALRLVLLHLKLLKPRLRVLGFLGKWFGEVREAWMRVQDLETIKLSNKFLAGLGGTQSVKH